MVKINIPEQTQAPKHIVPKILIHLVYFSHYLNQSGVDLEQYKNKLKNKLKKKIKQKKLNKILFFFF